MVFIVAILNLFNSCKIFWSEVLQSCGSSDISKTDVDIPFTNDATWENSNKLIKYLWCFTRYATICTILKSEKSPPATLIQITLLHGCFSSFQNCTNGTKSCKKPHLKIFHKLNTRFFQWYCYLLLHKLPAAKICFSCNASNEIQS